MKKRSRRAGFTLVELIVVIVILAILAAVAIPTYTGYIRKANEAADYQTLASIATAAAAVAAGNGETVEKIVVTRDPYSVTVNGAAVTDPLFEQLVGDDIEFTADWTTATMEDGAWTLAK
ncbi:MAG: prepilin-type N-terminal cleavage/methylation domain-containing protein [Oscillospiraceae bacterium]|nr:prepilin-type N-terminal cleavage/methylation domain-containing protein [Oscillospiraceae bacterium]